MDLKDAEPAEAESFLAVPDEQEMDQRAKDNEEIRQEGNKTAEEREQSIEEAMSKLDAAIRGAESVKEGRELEQQFLFDQRDAEQSKLYGQCEADDKAAFDRAQQEKKRQPPDFGAQQRAASAVSMNQPHGPVGPDIDRN